MHMHKTYVYVYIICYSCYHFQETVMLDQLRIRKREVFILPSLIFFFDAFPFFMSIQVSDLQYFPSLWRTSNVSYKAGLLVTNFLNFYFSENSSPQSVTSLYIF